MWGKIIIPMYRLWLNGLYGLYGPRCPLFSKRPINLISLSLSLPSGKMTPLYWNGAWICQSSFEIISHCFNPFLSRNVSCLHVQSTSSKGAYACPVKMFNPFNPSPAFIRQINLIRGLKINWKSLLATVSPRIYGILYRVGGLVFPYVSKFYNCKGKIVDSRAVPIWFLIHGSSWSRAWGLFHYKCSILPV